MTDSRAPVTVATLRALEALTGLREQREALQALAQADIDRRSWIAAEAPTDPGEERTEP